MREKRLIRTISREDAAAVVGVVSRTLLRAENEADPPPWTGDGYECVAFGKWLKRRWVRESGLDDDGVVYNYEQERARLTKAQADKTELEARELRGEMVRAEDVIESWGRMLGALRSRLLSIPSKSAPRARAAENDEQAAKLVEVEVLEALQELSDDGLPDRARARRDRWSRDPKTAAEADGK
jgi:hypothetical protein